MDETQRKISDAMNLIVDTCTTVEDTAKILKIDPQRVRLLCREGLLWAFKWSTTWIIPKTSLVSYLEAREAERQELLSKRARLSDVQALAKEVRDLARRLNIPLEELDYDKGEGQEYSSGRRRTS